MSFQFGVLQNVLGEPLSTVFQTARELGFEGVELDWNAPEEILEGGFLAPAERASIKASAEAAGVQIHAVCAHFLNNGGVASEDAQVRARGVQAIRDGLSLAHDLGATALLIPFFGAAERELTDKAGQERLLMTLQVLAGEAAKASVFMAIEHTLPGEVAARLIDATISTHVGDYWDMGNSMNWGHDPVAEVRALGTRIVRVHAKEFQSPSTRPAEATHGLNPVPLGQGEVPLADVLRELRRVGYKGFITLETGAFGDRRQSAQAAREVLAQAAASL